MIETKIKELKKTGDVLVIEPQSYENGTEAEDILDNNDEQIVIEKLKQVKYDGAQLWRIPFEQQQQKNAVAELQKSFGESFFIPIPLRDFLSILCAKHLLIICCKLEASMIEQIFAYRFYFQIEFQFCFRSIYY